MQPIQRAAVRSAKHLRSHAQRQQRRWASAESGGHGKHHAESVNESFGAGFYISLAALPASFALYKFSRQGTDEQPYFTRAIVNTYNSYKNTWANRNDVHTQMMEQAAADRVLFLNESSQTKRRVDHRFPEIMNMGSPWNVAAGQGSVNIDALIAKYEKEAFEDNEKKMQQLQENRVPREQPVDRLSKTTAAAVDS